MGLLEGLKREENYTFTENGALTNKSSNSKVLDYYAQGSALRNRTEKSIISLFSKAYAEDKLLALKVLFDSRNIRGGKGERETFKTIIKHLAFIDKDVVKKNIALIPQFGRWDDLYALFGTPLEKEAMELIKTQLKADIISENPSVLAKWLKSENTSSKESRQLATKTRKGLNMTPSQYRKTLSTLRKKIGIVETKVSTGAYSAIEYDKIPSGAGMKYMKAFHRKDGERYREFIGQVAKGEKQINSSVVYPYEIIRRVEEELRASWANNGKYNQDHIDSLQVMWDNLPDYVGDNEENVLVVADVSGSMDGTPMQIAVSLTLYLGEKNKGEFANYFMTFSRRPQLVEILGKDLAQKVRNIERADWGMNTDIEAIFAKILQVATAKNLDKSELPSRIIIISDMEFDNCVYDGRDTVFEKMRRLYGYKGYELPKLVFWNADSRNNNMPALSEDNVQFVSGATPAIFETVLANKFASAYELMLADINREIYNCITI